MTIMTHASIFSGIGGAEIASSQDGAMYRKRSSGSGKTTSGFFLFYGNTSITN